MPRSREIRRSANERYHRKLKLECFHHYGLPGDVSEDELDLWELHHPNGNGNKDRAEKIGQGLNSPGGWHFYLALKKLGYPEGYVVITVEEHDILHGRLRPDERHACAPGMENTRFDDIVPF